MGAIIDPVTSLFIQLDTDAVDRLAGGDETINQTALRCCAYATNLTLVTNQTLLNSIYKWENFTTLDLTNTTYDLAGVVVDSINFDNYIVHNGMLKLNTTACARECSYWCMPMLRAFGDAGTGLFWIVLSIVTLIVALFSIVKVASLIIVGPIAKQLSRALNASFPGKMRWATQVVLFLVAFVLTLIVQSSNIITATLVPLCGIGMISLQRVYVMTLGSNIGSLEF